MAFELAPTEIERRGGWSVARAYEGEAEPDQRRGPARLIDLSHRARWDFQHSAIDERRPLGCEVPPRPGEVAVIDGLMVNRMNRTQAALWHVGPADPPVPAADVGLTETTDSHCWLAIVGSSTPSVMEHLSSLDLYPNAAEPPFLTQGPVLHVPAQIVTWAADCVLLAIARGYGQGFVDAALHSAGRERLVPGGEAAFTSWVVASSG